MSCMSSTKSGIANILMFKKDRLHADRDMKDITCISKLGATLPLIRRLRRAGSIKRFKKFLIGSFELFTLLKWLDKCNVEMVAFVIVSNSEEDMS